MNPLLGWLCGIVSTYSLDCAIWHNYSYTAHQLRKAAPWRGRSRDGGGKPGGLAVSCHGLGSAGRFCFQRLVLAAAPYNKSLHLAALSRLQLTLASSRQGISEGSLRRVSRAAGEL